MGWGNQNCVRSINFFYFLMDFEVTWQKCLPSYDDVLHARLRSVSPRSRSHLEVKGKKWGLFLVSSP